MWNNQQKNYRVDNNNCIFKSNFKHVNQAKSTIDWNHKGTINSIITLRRKVRRRQRDFCSLLLYNYDIQPKYKDKNASRKTLSNVFYYFIFSKRFLFFKIMSDRLFGL